MSELTEPCFILLDIDGVLNRHGQNRHDNGYNGTEPECVSEFNRILKTVPNAQIVVISSWRYDVLSGRMNVAGIEALLLTHGVMCKDRIVGVTASDADIAGHVRPWSWLEARGAVIRRIQVWRWLYGNDPYLSESSSDDLSWVVLDDMDLHFRGPWKSRQIVTDKSVGLTAADADRAIAILTGRPYRDPDPYCPMDQVTG
jgi:hypothetical protein